MVRNYLPDFQLVVYPITLEEIKRLLKPYPYHVAKNPPKGRRKEKVDEQSTEEKI